MSSVLDHRGHHVQVGVLDLGIASMALGEVGGRGDH